MCGRGIVPDRQYRAKDDEPLRAQYGTLPTRGKWIMDSTADLPMPIVKLCLAGVMTLDGNTSEWFDQWEEEQFDTKADMASEDSR